MEFGTLKAECVCGSVAGCMQSQEDRGVCLSRMIRKRRRCGDREEGTRKAREEKKSGYRWVREKG
jgi:hypothetical protein